MKRRVQKVLERAAKERPWLSFSDVLREVIDNGLRTMESSGSNDVTPEAARAAGATRDELAERGS